jgi:predicted DCC family thiol-disulfide oxidoreductase YuxK
MNRASVLLYDGHCRLCSAGARRLLRWARPGAIELADVHDPGTLPRFPGLTLDACLQALHLVAANGRVFRAAEAVVVVLLTAESLLLGATLLPARPALPVDRGIAGSAIAIVWRAGRCAEAGCALHSRR